MKAALQKTFSPWWLLALLILAYPRFTPHFSSNHYYIELGWPFRTCTLILNGVWQLPGDVNQLAIIGNTLFAILVCCLLRFAGQKLFPNFSRTVFTVAVLSLFFAVTAALNYPGFRYVSDLMNGQSPYRTSKEEIAALYTEAYGTGPVLKLMLNSTNGSSGSGLSEKRKGGGWSGGGNGYSSLWNSYEIASVDSNGFFVLFKYAKGRESGRKITDTNLIFFPYGQTTETNWLHFKITGSFEK